MVKKESIELSDIFPEVDITKLFISDYSKRLKSGEWKKKTRIQIKKIICDPNVGKPMKGARRGTREVYIDDKSFRLSYYHSRDKEILRFLRIYPKKKQKKK